MLIIIIFTKHPQIIFFILLKVYIQSQDNLTPLCNFAFSKPINKYL
jgi:hypothetical protein